MSLLLYIKEDGLAKSMFGERANAQVLHNENIPRNEITQEFNLNKKSDAQDKAEAAVLPAHGQCVQCHLGGAIRKLLENSVSIKEDLIMHMLCMSIAISENEPSSRLTKLQLTHMP